jgi:hypothetical protein
VGQQVEQPLQLGRAGLQVRGELRPGLGLAAAWPDPADLAQRDDVMNDLWQRSARMVGLTDE